MCRLVLLTRIQKVGNMDEMNKQIEQFTEELAKHNIKAKEITHITGPQVITYRFELTDGYTPEQFSKDIEKIEPKARFVPIENTNYIDVEVPSICRQMVWLKDLLKSPEFKNSPYKSPVILGVDTVGKTVCYDFENMPGLLIAGRAGCGKTQLMYSILLSLMKKQKHDKCKFVIFDTKSGDLYYFDWCSYMLNPVQTNAEKTNGLGCVESEVLTRHQLVLNNKKDELKEYPRLVVIIDEFNDLLSVHGKKFAKWVTRVLSNAQGTKIHIIMATSVLGSDTLLDSFKEFFSCKAYFLMNSKRDLLGNKNTMHLHEYGDMLFSDGNNRTIRIHTPFILKDNLKTYFVKKGKKAATKKLLEMLQYEFPLHVVQDLIKMGADVNAKTKWGDPLLHWIDNPQIIQVLIDAGADVNAIDDMGRNAL